MVIKRFLTMMSLGVNFLHAIFIAFFIAMGWLIPTNHRPVLLDPNNVSTTGETTEGLRASSSRARIKATLEQEQEDQVDSSFHVLNAFILHQQSLLQLFGEVIEHSALHQQPLLQLFGEIIEQSTLHQQSLLQLFGEAIERSALLQQSRLQYFGGVIEQSALHQQSLLLHFVEAFEKSLNSLLNLLPSHLVHTPKEETSTESTPPTTEGMTEYASLPLSNASFPVNKEIVSATAQSGSFIFGGTTDSNSFGAEDRDEDTKPSAVVRHAPFPSFSSSATSGDSPRGSNKIVINRFGYANSSNHFGTKKNAPFVPPNIVHASHESAMVSFVYSNDK
jgi:hypothetical protein